MPASHRTDASSAKRVFRLTRSVTDLDIQLLSNEIVINKSVKQPLLIELSTMAAFVLQ